LHCGREKVEKMQNKRSIIRYGLKFFVTTAVLILQSVQGVQEWEPHF